eukprot:13929659-Alexandrium_andersonii.AAC.1
MPRPTSSPRGRRSGRSRSRSRSRKRKPRPRPKRRACRCPVLPKSSRIREAANGVSLMRPTN